MHARLKQGDHLGGGGQGLRPRRHRVRARALRLDQARSPLSSAGVLPTAGGARMEGCLARVQAPVTSPRGELTACVMACPALDPPPRFIVECLTDNVNRSASDVKAAMTKGGAKPAEPGSVAFNFQRRGMVRAIKGRGRVPVHCPILAHRPAVVKRSGARCKTAGSRGSRGEGACAYPICLCRAGALGPVAPHSAELPRPCHNVMTPTPTRTIARWWWTTRTRTPSLRRRWTRAPTTSSR